MSETVRSRLVHALLSMLLAVGLLLPLLGILDSALVSPLVLLPVAVVILIFELSSINRITRLAAAGVSAVLLLLWLFAMGGMLTVSDVVMAVVLRFNGILSAVPLVSTPAAIILTIVVTLVSCFACLRNASILPATLLCFGMILLIYLTASEQVIPMFLPALAALLLLLMTERFPETPLPHLLPFAALLVVLAFLLAGNGTGQNALRQKADELRQAVLDRLFFTEPRDVFSLRRDGYYPQGQDQLGGKPNPKDDPVMIVSTPRNVYLRGVILNDYTGRKWQNTTGARRYLRQSARLASMREALFDENLPSPSVRNALCEPVTVSVRMLSESASTLFVPQRVRELYPGGDLVPYFSNSSELFITRNLKPDDTYSVSAPLFQAGDPGLGTLIEVCSTLEDSAYSDIVDTYTVLPNHLEEPVYAIAVEVSSIKASPYEKALALQSWLARNCRYTLDVEPQSANDDFVTHFLLDTREGYCTHFASAMTVLCRMIGLPARYIEGYLAEPDEDGNALVTGLSAHAWTEVYFSGFGWLTFDATPRRSGNNNSDNNNNADSSDSPSAPPTENTPEPTPEPTPDPSQDPQQDPPQNSPEPPPETPEPESSPQDTASGSSAWFWILLLLLIAAAALRIWLTSPVTRAKRAGSEMERFDIWTQEISDLLSAENLTRRKGETPMAFGRRIDRTARFGVSLNTVCECISLIRYSRSSATDTDTGLVRDSSVLLKSELSRPALARYFFRRIFVPVKKRLSL
ncbi:transglutaminase-like domain-containing protein [Aristaeella lactis]|uniref:Transglutaminase-like superfamily protein n=1 Tax=Aristaeella lactis TaxID=3046383 RepID=A0AC61PHU4_9FIRM|nr:transglutaminase-like domain-containing protein [Aristaeella lactis]QUA53558.1 transglutaminase domain-containing protein [Aristaeella lactis]SMC36752.1 Transglutaminase-like superfamily protein [Aristaeella lactis]